MSERRYHSLLCKSSTSGFIRCVGAHPGRCGAAVCECYSRACCFLDLPSSHSACRLIASGPQSYTSTHPIHVHTQPFDDNVGLHVLGCRSIISISTRTIHIFTSPNPLNHTYSLHNPLNHTRFTSPNPPEPHPFTSPDLLNHTHSHHPTP